MDSGARSDARVVVVGASLAGAHTALELRRLGHDGPVTLVGAEPHLPYERPELSKGYLGGSVGLDALLVAPEATYAEAGIDLRLGVRASGVDTASRLVQLADGEALAYDSLVVATGSANLRPRIDGMDLPGVYQLRTLDDAQRLAAAARSGGRAVVVGTGLVGCEVAATLTAFGLSVTAVDALPGPLWAQLGAELSTLVLGWHEQHGVTFFGGAGVTAIEGSERAERVRLADGQVLEADLVVVGVGARPMLDWLAGVPVDLAAGGLAVDAALRTNLPGIYAAGDVAAVQDDALRGHRRTEHYMSAVEQGQRVAHVLVGAEPPASQPEWFWSHQYGHYLQYAGRHEPDDELVLRPAPFAAFFLRDSVVRAVATVDNGRDLRRAVRLLGRTVDRALLVDPAVDLRKVA